MTLSYIPPEMVNGKPVIQLDMEKFNRNEEIWRKALVLYVVGNTSSYSFMEKYIARNWNQIKKPEIFLHEDGFFVVKF